MGRLYLMKKNASSGTNCPCGSGLTLAACCGRFHAGLPAPDAISLMRSRYSAYALGLEPYILATWHKSTRPKKLNLHTKTSPKWINLKILASQQHGDHATVEFIASYTINGRAGKMHETSYFVLEKGQWLYVNGKIHEY
jgi:SEC-C motif-containing protein